MRAAAHGMKQAGFSLVEILIALFIIALMSSAIVLNLPKGTDPVFKSAQDMAFKLETAAERSLMERRVYGVRFAREAIEIIAYNPNLEEAADEENDTGVEAEGWEVIHAIKQPQNVPYRIKLKINGTEINLSDSAKSPYPLIRYSPTGIATPFTMQIDTSGKSVLLSGDANGRVTAAQQGGF